MNQDAVRLGAIAAVVIAVLAVAGVLYQQSEAEKQRVEASQIDDTRLVRPHSHIQGPADAKVTVVEWLDPECESCRAMYPYVKQIQEEFGDQMRLVIRYMPYHKNSIYAAGTLEAAAEQGRYWEFLHLLLLNQPAWGNHHDPRPELIPELAEQMGLDMQAFQASLDVGAFRELVEIDKQDGVAVGVKGTPTFFVNGEMLLELDPEKLRDMIRAELDDA